MDIKINYTGGWDIVPTCTSNGILYEADGAYGLFDALYHHNTTEDSELYHEALSSILNTAQSGKISGTLDSVIGPITWEVC